MSIESVQVQAQFNFIRTPPMFTQHEYECRPWSVMCIFCKHTATDTEKNLREYGWHLGNDEVCPECEQRV